MKARFTAIPNLIKVLNVSEIKWKLEHAPSCVFQNYLSDQDFADVFGISRGEFSAMPGWKQITLKKRHGLF